MGGLAKHMLHPHEDLNLTFGGLKGMVQGIFCGDLEMKEKLDGFNIHFLKVNNQLRMARNAKDLNNLGFGPEDITSRFSTDRIRGVFMSGYEWMQNHLPEIDLPDFEIEHVTLNCEIISHTTNVLLYMVERCYIHNLYRWNQESDGSWDFEIEDYRGLYSSPIVELKEHCVDVDKLMVELDEIVRPIIPPHKFVDDVNLYEYYQARFANYWMERIQKGEKFDYSIEFLKVMFRRLFPECQSIVGLPVPNLRDIRKDFPDLDVDEFLKHSSEIIHYIKQHLDHWVLKVGNLILSNVTGFINSADQTAWASQTALRNNILCATAEMAAKNMNDPKLKLFEERFRASGSQVNPLEGVVVQYGTRRYGIKRYKWTGSFAPINRLLGGKK